jgi:hypothetical protein
VATLSPAFSAIRFKVTRRFVGSLFAAGIPSSNVIFLLPQSLYRCFAFFASKSLLGRIEFDPLSFGKILLIPFNIHAVSSPSTATSSYHRSDSIYHATTELLQ